MPAPVQKADAVRPLDKHLKTRQDNNRFQQAISCYERQTIYLEEQKAVHIHTVNSKLHTHMYIYALYIYNAGMSCSSIVAIHLIVAPSALYLPIWSYMTTAPCIEVLESKMQLA